MRNNQRAYLILEDGTVFKGKSFGAEKETFGEIVFNTGMTGYQEVLSDPSYCGQIVTMTYPLIGNYGINRDDFESLSPALHALVVKEWCDYPSNWRNEMTIDDLLKEREIPGIHDIDTRKLTRLIRQHGTMKAKLVQNVNEEQIPQLVTELQQQPLMKDQVSRVSTRNSFHCPGNQHRVVLVDFGCKAGILRELTNRHCDVRVVPYDITSEEILRLRPDGVLLSNGPGDPKDVPQAIAMIKGILGKAPLFGICLGHQLFALACGGDTHKLTFGHRGSNHPVKDVDTHQTYMTSQNHGYSVDPQSLTNTRLQISQVAVNDGTVEGLKHLDYAAFSVQYHPEASPGPYDSNSLFDQFMALMDAEKLEKKRQTNQKQTEKGEVSYATL